MVLGHRQENRTHIRVSRFAHSQLHQPMQFAPYPPSPDETDQHTVVTLLITLCPCDFAGHDLYMRESNPLAHAPARHHEALKRAQSNLPSWRVVLASAFSDYRLHRLLD